MTTVQVVHAAVMTVQVVRAVLILIVHQHVAASVIDQIVPHVRVAMMIVQPVVVAQVRVVHQQVVALVIAIRVQVVRAVMMIVHAVSMIVHRVHKPMRSVAPIKFVHARVAAVMIATQHRVTIISKSVGKMRARLVHLVVDWAVVITMHQSIWNVTRSAHQRQHLLT
jgi:hypothetical protein